MAPFETPHALDNAEIKTLQENKNELSDDMKVRLQDTQKRDLFVSEYRNYLQRSQNEASKDMVAKLFGNIFKLAEKEGISMNTLKELVVEGNNTTDGLAQGDGSKLDENSANKLRDNLGLSNNAEIVITEPIDIKKECGEVLDSIINEGYMKKQSSNEVSGDNRAVIDPETQSINKMIAGLTKTELNKRDIPIITPENVNDPVIQSTVEDIMYDVATTVTEKSHTVLSQYIDQKQLKVGTPLGDKIIGMRDNSMGIVQRKETFASIINSIENNKNVKSQGNAISSDLENLLYGDKDSADIVIESNGKKELMPHRELSTEIFEGLEITKQTKENTWSFINNDGQKIVMSYYKLGGRPNLKITKSSNLDENYAAESVTIEGKFGKDGNISKAKSFRYEKTTPYTSKKGKEKYKDESRTATKESYPAVKEFLGSTGPDIADWKLEQGMS